MRRGREARERRRAVADELADARAKRTDFEQLARLVKAGHGQCKEADRLRLATTDHDDDCPLCILGKVAHIKGEVRCQGECGAATPISADSRKEKK